VSAIAEPKQTVGLVGTRDFPHFRGSWSSFLLGSGGAAFVAVVQATDLTHGHNWPDIPSVNRSWFWRVR